MQKSKKALIFGASGFAEVVHFYLTNDSDYDVVAFTTTKDALSKDTLLGLPIVPFEEVEKWYPPTEYEMFIAVGYINMNKSRAHFFKEAKIRGYKCLTYVSSKATCWSKEIGENCFIFEDNTIQPFVRIGNNVILWSGNHLGHHSEIGDHCFISSHVVISGHCLVKEYTFIGVNATLRDALTIGRENIIGAGALILKDTKDKEVYAARRTEVFPKDSSQIKSI